MTTAPARAAVQGLRKVGSQFIVMQPPSDAYLPRDQHGWYNHCMVAPATKSMDRLLTTLADCLTRESAERVEHLRALQHGGSDDPANLAFACERCNVFKGPNLSAVDPLTGAVVELFHPRTHAWTEHFRWDGVKIVGVTDIGRATVALLNMNA